MEEVFKAGKASQDKANKLQNSVAFTYTLISFTCDRICDQFLSRKKSQKWQAKMSVRSTEGKCINKQQRYPIRRMVFSARRNGCGDEEEDIYLAQTVMTMNITV